MNTYLIRGFTGPNADFSFKVEAPAYPTGLALRDVVLGHFQHECDWATDLKDNAHDIAYELSEDEERSDLRETDSQRVWVYDSTYCNLDEDLYNSTHRCGEDGDGNGDDTECDYDSYMITVDLIDTEDQ